MPDLGNFPPSSSCSPAPIRCPAHKPHSDDHSVKTLVNGSSPDAATQEDVAGGPPRGPKSMEEHVESWVRRKVESGADKSRCFLPFLVGAKKMGECLVCHCPVCPDEELLCSVRECEGIYHLACATSSLSFIQAKKFRCPQHECFVCKQKFQWRCVRCPMASHDKCAPWPGKVIRLESQPGRAVCWRHPTNWLLETKVNPIFSSAAACWPTGLIYLLNEQHDGPANNMEEVFYRLPLPYIAEDFKFDAMWVDKKESYACPPTWSDRKESYACPPPYVHIRRNVYLVKKKLDDDAFDVGCAHCTSECCQDCVCRVQCISCSKGCRCSDDCTNRPFRKEKKTKIVKTAFCGWGVEAAEPISKNDFVIEYIGEVIDDAQCERRLWDMKYRGVQNFYMCEIRKDFTIDATFKGNTSRFLNHSCDPNCILEKWQVEGETRVGVFAARDIEIGEPLTYDYRFVQFGPEVRCYCGTAKCQGYLGTKKKVCSINICWGAKRRRSSIACLAILTI